MNVINFQDANCAHCYKCLRNCSVKAIRVKSGQAMIVRDQCVYCGHCMEICPQHAKTLESDLDYVKRLLESDQDVVVSLDPSYRGLLNIDEPGKIVDALMKLGFSQVRETAEGAAAVTEEYVRLLNEEKMDNIISTNCAGIIYLVEKHYPMLIPYLAPVVSPMIAHGRMLKKMLGEDTKVVFIGPCVSKKMEAESDPKTRGVIDAVIEFNELERWLEECGIELDDCEAKPFANRDPLVNQLYPVTNGIIRSVKVYDASPTYKMLTISTMDGCREFLHSMKRGYIHHCFAELNLCAGGCVNGPGVNKSRGFRFKAMMSIENNAQMMKPNFPKILNKDELVRDFSDKQVLDKEPSEEEIKEILKTIGKSGSDTEFNCGACGYMSCREKAIAIYQGKAEAEMCLIRTYDNARSQANVVMDSTPNLVIIVDGDMKIKELNKKAEKVFKIERRKALNTYLFELMEDVSEVEEVYLTREMKTRVKKKWPLYDMYVYETIVYIEKTNRILIIIEDATEEEKYVERQIAQKLESVKIAQSVIDKQMTTAQQIAGLLGETTAETKAILTKLRDAILEDTIGDQN